MDAKEFFEKNKGKYFDYQGHKVRVVGMSSTSSPILVSGYMYGWDISHKNNKLIDFIDNSLVKNNDKLWFASIDLLKQEEFNLCELLNGCEGMVFYSTMVGYCKLIDVVESIIIGYGDDDDYIVLESDGKYSIEGECTLFPSKENRDWSTFKKPIKIKEGDPVMCFNGINNHWTLFKYNGGIKTYYKYIVLATEFDFTDFDSNKSKSII